MINFKLNKNGCTGYFHSKDTKIYKRWMLALFLVPFIPFIPHMDILDNGVYYSVTIGLCAYAFFINFPWLIKVLHSSPVYYEDLEDEKYEDHHSRKQHQSVFIFSNQILIALITMSLVYYYQYKYIHSNLSLFEMAGVLWGIASLMLSIYNFMAKITKSLISWWKKRRSRKISIDESKMHQLTFSLSDLNIKTSKIEATVELTSNRVITV